MSLVRSLCLDVTPSVRHLWLDLTDVTLADEDTNSILTDTANRAFQCNLQLMQVTQPGLVGKLMEVVAKFATDASGAIWWPNLQLMQVEPSGGKFCN